MKKIISLSFLVILACFTSGCASHMSHDYYNENSTLNIALEGKIISFRDVKIRSEEKQKATSAIGALTGGAAGYALTHKSSSSNLGLIGGAIAGGVVGSSFGTHNAIEYIVQIDKSQIADRYYHGSNSIKNSLEAIKATGLVTVIQTTNKDNPCEFTLNQHVIVIVTNDRTRIIPKSI